MAEERSCTYDPLVELMKRFENVRATSTGEDAFSQLSVEDKLKKHIVDGVKKNLDRHLDEALQTYAPLAIINDILLDGMKTVGELFGAGKMQLPFVLQSAEVMKAAVRHLEPLMEKVEGAEKGSILLATVAGDVHDIGKNLVDIILSNNGYRVVNIGIKQPINSILEQCAAHQCQVIGMSGLLVKSTVIMKENLLEMNERGLHGIPVILGGAALTRSYVEEDLRSLYRGSVHYAQDAFEGLRLMEQIGAGKSEGGQESAQAAASLVDEIDEIAASRLQESQVPSSLTEVRARSHRVDTTDPVLYRFDGEKSDTEPAASLPELPFYGVRYREQFDIFEIYKYINLTALWRGQWQFRRPEGMDNLQFNAYLEEHARPVFDRLQRDLARVFTPKVAWGYFWCRSEGNDLIVYEADARTERIRFTFPRQRDGRRLCLSDFFRPVESAEPDVVGFQIVTAGPEVSRYERDLFERGEFQDYLYVHGMGVETAEALAEYWHKIVRNELGIGHNDPADMKGLFGVKYQGARYSFGYPACPNLEDQAKLFELLQPQKIGIDLTEEFMLDPEQSTSAIIMHHPAAKYFNIR